MTVKYKCVTMVREIEEYIGNSKIVAFDFETSPNDTYRNEDKAALDPAKAHIVGCSFSITPGTAIYVPVAHKDGKNIDKADFMLFLRKFLTNSEITKVVHNAAFESTFSYAAGIVILPPVYDTMCASQMSLKSDYEFRTLADSGLKTLVPELFGEELPTFASVTNGKHFDELDSHDAETVRYGCADSDYALRLYYLFNDWFDAYLPKHRKIVEEIESPTAVYLGIMKANGIPVDTELMNKRREEVTEKIENIKHDIEFMIGDVEIGSNCSTAAFKNYLFKDLELPLVKETQSGKAAVDDAAMVLLKEWCDKNKPEIAPLFGMVQDYRKLGKLISTYIDGYKRYINKATGKIHPDIFALCTDTGRMNCSKPNAQNMPRKTNDPIGVRDFIKAPAGHLIISVDFSQIELRVGAFYCRDKVMLETYRNNGDIHAATTSVIFGISYEDAQNKHRPGYKEQRTIAKNVNFGTFYGLYAKGLQQTLKFKAGINKNFDECQQILDSLKSGYPGLTSWQKSTKDQAHRDEYTETWLGRRRYIPGISSDDWGKKSFAERCALNTPIQGTAADILKMAVVRILRGLPEREWLKPILQIHDELTFIIPEEKLSEAVAYIKNCMEEKPFPAFDLPLIAEASAGRTFGTLEELED